MLPPSSRIEAASLAFPVLLWRKGYIHLATDAMELCAHPRSLFEESKASAQNGELCLADSGGSVFQLTDFERVRPSGGVKSIPYRLLLSVFCMPVGHAAPVPDIDAFKQLVISAVRSRYRHDRDSPQREVIRAIRASATHQEVMRAIPSR